MHRLLPLDLECQLVETTPRNVSWLLLLHNIPHIAKKRHSKHHEQVVDQQLLRELLQGWGLLQE